MTGTHEAAVPGGTGCTPVTHPNAALGACDAPNATLGASDAPNATLGRSPRRQPRASAPTGRNTPRR
ncbi:hypothetical protein CU254_07325 [Amycolatopsis sp. AA4]|nr:hypothetical protein CU254_07325 [Amycolatopsis sp. AA4]